MNYYVSIQQDEACETVSLFNFYKILLIHFIRYVFFWHNIYLHVFFFFYNTSSHISSYTSKPCYKSHILMSIYALTLTEYKFLDIRIVVGSMSHIKIAIGFETMHNRASCKVEGVHWETCKYWVINAINCLIIIIIDLMFTLRETSQMTLTLRC